MKKLLFFLILLLPLTASAQFSVTQGGMGTSTWQTKSIPFFGGFRFTENNAAFNFFNAGQLLTVPNASTTALSADVFCLTGDACRTTWPAGGGGGSGNVSTSSVPVIGQLAYWTTTTATPALLSTVATTTVTFSGPFGSYASLGALVGGSNSTITWWGLSTTSQPASSNLLVSNGGAGVYGIATSTLTASSPLTGSFVQVGSGGSVGIQAATAAQAGFETQNEFNYVHTATTTFSAPLVYTGSTNAVTCTNASNSVTGCLTAADWALFNNKVSSSSLAALFPFTKTAYGVSTSTTVGFTNGILVNAASSTIVGNATTTGMFESGTASSTNLYGAGLIPCTAGNVLTWTGGKFGCAADSQGSAAWPFTTGLQNFGVAVQSTTTPEWFKNGLMASTTSYFVYASSTAFTTGDMTVNSGAVGTSSVQIGQTGNPACVVTTDTVAGTSYTYWKAGIMYVSTVSCL